MKFATPALLFVLLVLGGAAGAQSVEEPLMGSQSSPGMLEGSDAPVTGDGAGRFGGADGIFRILVIGDSLAGGFGAGLARMAQEDEGIEIVNRFNEASGLARPEFYDWVAAVPKIVIAKDYDAAVVELGLNDRQAIRNDAVQLEFRSEPWVSTYKAQVGALAEKLLGAGLNVYWLALPPVADPQLDADLKIISNLQKEAVQAKGAHYVDLSQYFLDASGRYSERGPDETGADRKLRARDGITFMKQGNSRVGQLLLAAIKKKEAEGGIPTSVANSRARARGSITIDVGPALPKFGQQGLDGEELAFNAADIKPSAAVGPLANAGPPKIHAAAGSAAEALFTTGAGVIAPSGRFDDFSLPSNP